VVGWLLGWSAHEHNIFVTIVTFFDQHVAPTNALNILLNERLVCVYVRFSFRAVVCWLSDLNR
jgi:hypothetical protein